MSRPQTQEVPVDSARAHIIGYRPDGRPLWSVMGAGGGQAPAAADQQQQETGDQPPAGGQQQQPQEGELTEAQLNQLPDWARESISKANREAAKYRTERNTLQEVVNEVGGVDRVKELHWYTSSQDGIKELFNELSDVDNLDQMVGVSGKQLKDLLSGAQEAAAEQAEKAEQAKGEALTKEQVAELVQTNVKEAIAGVTQAQDMENLRDTVSDYLKQQGFDSDWEFTNITQLAAVHQKDDDLPSKPGKFGQYLSAIDRGIEDFKSKLGTAKDEYLRAKAADAEGAPKANAGTTPAAGEKWDPSELDWADLAQQAQERGYFPDTGG